VSVSITLSTSYPPPPLFLSFELTGKPAMEKAAETCGWAAGGLRGCQPWALRSVRVPTLLRAHARCSRQKTLFTTTAPLRGRSPTWHVL